MIAIMPFTYYKTWRCQTAKNVLHKYQKKKLKRKKQQQRLKLDRG